MAMRRWLEGHVMDSVVVNGQRKRTFPLVKDYRFVNIREFVLEFPVPGVVRKFLFCYTIIRYCLCVIISELLVHFPWVIK